LKNRSVASIFQGVNKKLSMASLKLIGLMPISKNSKNEN